MDYVIKDNQIQGKFAVKLDEDEEIESFKGSELVGLTYTPLFPYFADNENSFKILSADFVEEGSGTGIVHIAPGFGEDDQIVGDKAGIPLVLSLIHI